MFTLKSLRKDKEDGRRLRLISQDKYVKPLCGFVFLTS